METWDIDQVSRWLESILSNSSDVKSVFVKENITGKALSGFTYDHHRLGALSSIPVGIFTEIMMEKEKLLNEESDESTESHQISIKSKRKAWQTFRPFGVYNTYEYDCGSKFYKTGNLHGTNVLLPLHYYVDFRKVESNMQIFMVENILKFTCACINDRINGTIHFGVSDEGEVIGIEPNVEKVESKFAEIISKCFPPDQADIVKYCLSRLHKVAVLQNQHGKTKYVFELDVIPYTKICKDVAFVVRMPYKSTINESDFHAYRIKNGVPFKLEPDDLIHFLRQVSALSDIREEAERSVTKIVDNTYLKDQLIDLLSLGDRRMHPDSYPILLLSKPEDFMTPDESIKENFSFIRDVAWKAIFDFDAAGIICNYMQEIEKQNMRVLKVEEFDSKRDALRNCDSLKDEIKGSVQVPWIFSNGFSDGSRDYEPSETSVEWLRHRGQHGFKDFTHFLKDQIPEERAIIVIMILSEDTKIISTAACEICSLFPDQYVIITENAVAAESLQIDLVGRGYTIDIETAKARSVVGIPWKHVNSILETMFGQGNKEQPELPASFGTCLLDERIRNKWTDLDILCSNECDRETSITMDPGAVKEKQDEVEMDFYRGTEVCWWNFWFKSQVMPRDIHPQLKDSIEKVLRGRLPEFEDAPVARITLYHQPGAGGTTCARHVLWDLHQVCRCAVISCITESTVDQVLEFYLYQESSNCARPILLLLDNIDGDKSVNFIATLEHKAKEFANISPRTSKHETVSVILLICKRTSILPRHIGKLEHKYDKRLSQDLGVAERTWLKDKHASLETNFEEKRGLNPKYLIAFNVLREGFNSDHIRTTVSQLLEDIRNPQEKLLLKFLAFLNTFDLQHRQVSIPIFDDLMHEHTYQKLKKKIGNSRGGYGRMVTANKQWELRLSHPTKILVVEGTERGFQNTRTIGIIHPALSKELYEILSVRKDGKKQSTVEVVQQFFDCKAIFCSSSHAKFALFKIVKDILIQRSRDESGKPLKPFSPLIEHIKAKETPEKALEVLEKGHSITQDPFVAQQIARFYISVENWEKAESFADIATQEKQTNSYMWDTYAQVFKKQLVEKHNALIADNRPISSTETLSIVDIANNAIQKFKKEQKASDDEHTPVSNVSGFFGEVESFILLMGCMTYLDIFFSKGKVKGKEMLRKFMTEQHDLPDTLKEWRNVDGKDYISILKQMRIDAQNTLHRMEDEDVQLRECYQDNHTQHTKTKANYDMIKLNGEMASYFGEDTDNIPSRLCIEDKCNFRRRRVISISGLSMRGVYDLAREESGEDQLSRLLQHMRNNIDVNPNPEDYRVAITVVFALLPFQTKVLYEIPYETVVEWSCKLYEVRDKLDLPYLEPYLFYAMLNWPLYEDTVSRVTPKELENALQQWRRNYFEKYPMQREEKRYKTKRETVMFFFANGSQLNSVANYEDLKKQQGEIKLKSSEFWRDPHILRTLKRFKGILNSDGDGVSLQLKFKGNAHHIQIPTSLPKRDKNMLNKSVFFAIGFSWSGPKAYDVDIQDPNEDTESVSYGHENPKPDQKSAGARPKTNPTKISQWEFLCRLQEIRKELEILKKLQKKRKLNKQEVNVSFS